MTEPVALITGAGRRIGAEIARSLHSTGYRVALHYRGSKSEVTTLAQSLNAQRKNSAHCLQADLDQTAQVRQLAQQALNHWERMDLLVNNASIFYPTPLGATEESHWEQLMASNLKAPFFLAQALADALKENRGCIVNIADIHGERPLAGHSVYSIAKAGNRMLTKSLALELAPDVRVNGIAPGAMLWPEDSDGREIVNAAALEKIPLQRLGGAENIARAVIFLAGKDNYMTGHILTVDGGRSLRQ